MIEFESEVFRNRISAGELRAAGIPVDATVPDCATIAREHVRMSAGGGATLDGVTLTIPLTIEFRGPFEWVTGTVTFQKKPDA